MPTSNRIAPSVRLVRSLDGTYYMLREAADLLGVSHRTLRNLNNSNPEELGPSFFTYLGKIKIYLYTEDDVERLRQHLSQAKVIYSASDPGPVHQKGRPPKWSAEQRKMRQRKFSQVHYYKQQARKHANKGDQEKADKAIKKMRQIQKQLRDQDMTATYGKPTQDG